MISKRRIQAMRLFFMKSAPALVMLFVLLVGFTTIGVFVQDAAADSWACTLAKLACTAMTNYAGSVCSQYGNTSSSCIQAINEAGHVCAGAADVCNGLD